MDRQRLEQIMDLKGLSKTTKEAYLYYFGCLQKILAGSNRELDQEVLDLFINTYKGASPCRAFMKIYLEEENLDRELKIYKRTGAIKVKRRTYITPEEVGAVGRWMLSHEQNPRYFLMLWLTYECGLRRKEILNVMPGDFGWSEWLKEPSRRGKLKINLKGAKRQKERYVIIPSWLMKAVYVFLKDNEAKLDDRETIFKVQKMAWQNHFKRATRLVLRKEVTLHDLRFSRATYWYKQGLDVRQIKIRLGHSKIETTYRYIDPAEEEEMDAWQELG